MVVFDSIICSLYRIMQCFPTLFLKAHQQYTFFKPLSNQTLLNQLIRRDSKAV